LKLLQSAWCPRCAADRIDPGLTQVVENVHGRCKVEDFPLLVTVVNNEVLFNHGPYLLQVEVVQAYAAEGAYFFEVIRTVQGKGQNAARRQVIAQLFQQTIQVINPVKG